MTQFQYLNQGNTEAQDKLATSFLLQQVSTGKAATGVLTGLGVAQTTTASGSVTVGAGAGVVQAAVLDGADVLVNDSPATLDVLTANPMSSVPRNDIVVFDTATTSLRVLIGTPSSTPSDPTVPSSCIPLARLRQIATGQPGAGTIPTSVIDDLRSYTSLFAGQQPYAHYYRGASGSIAPNVTTKLSIPLKVEASGIAYSGGDFTVSQGGLYQCSFQVMFPGAAGLSQIGAQIYVNDAVQAFAWTPASSVTLNWSGYVAQRVRLAAGDKVSFYARHNSTASNTTVPDAGATWAQIQYVGP